MSLKLAVIILLGLNIFGCCESKIDQCLREKFFNQCMKDISLSINNEDLSDAVRQCDIIAKSQSSRIDSVIKPECKMY